ncbi:hypothetical protein WJX75_005427 [Coccomyxa subellipsoidea]|uniref:Elongation factor Ts, mitochondrial n=1 Tax=Coccomyxa subellipsoidea TaxID=248742 RepID=A0ABR2YW38_9CHLO
MSAIKSLRERTNAPISDVKSALVEAEWDLEGAYKTLRKKGVAAASKKASRHAAEGLIGIAHEPGIAALVEVNSETDFATKTEQFRNMVSTVASAALTAEASETGSIDSRTLSASSSASGTSVSDAVSECAGSVRENIQMRRAHRIACPSGVIASYLHASPSPGLGKMGAVVALVDKQGKLEGAAADKAHELGSKLAMHIVAARPLSLDRHSLPSEALEAEKAVLVEQARKSGKPANIIERMVAGRMHKFYEDSCLLDQKYVLDETRKIGQGSRPSLRRVQFLLLRELDRSGMEHCRCLRPWLILLLGTILAPSVYSAVRMSTEVGRPITVPWDSTLRPNTTFLSLTEGLAADNSTSDQPSQIHLSVAGRNAVSVNWASQKAKVGKGPLEPNDPWAAPSMVIYGTDPTNLNKNATGSAQVYSQIYNSSYAFWGGNTTLNYTSPVLHTVILSNLQPGTRYYYRVGDGNTFSSTISFRSLNDAGMEYPQRLLLRADWGLSANSSTTLDHIVQSALNSTSPPLVLYAADYSYADTWYPNGSVSSPNTAVEGSPNAGTYQPVWDAWQRFIQPLVGQVPFVGSTGNHEEEQEADGSTFKSVQARWPTPHLASLSPSFFFYSVNAGPTHNIILSNYVDYTEFSPQKNWLAMDLMTVDRRITPWVTITFHNPWYTTDSSYKEFEQMRISLEPLTYQYGVDVFFYGHVHSYERTAPVYNYTVNPCGAVHITIGDGGNSEGISFLAKDLHTQQFEDFNGGCPNVTAAQPRPSYLVPLNPSKDPWAWYQRTLTFNADGNSTGVGNPPGYCYKEQPEWSQYRESSFGHGTFDALNSTHALWSWHANQDGEAVARDQLYIIRDTKACPNRLRAKAAAPPPVAASIGANPLQGSAG